MTQYSTELYYSDIEMTSLTLRCTALVMVNARLVSDKCKVCKVCFENVRGWWLWMILRAGVGQVREHSNHTYWRCVGR